MATDEDLCLFCVEKIIPYTVSSNLEREGRFGGVDTPPHPPSFKNLCDILRVVVTDELLKGLKNHSSFVDTTDIDGGGGGGGESCKRFLCLNCFESVEKLSNLCQELELIKKKIEDGRRSIRDLITLNIANELDNKRGKKRKSSSLEFIEVFQKLVKESADSDGKNNASEVPPSAIARINRNAKCLEATSKPKKRQFSKKKRSILIQAEEDEPQNDDNGNVLREDVKLEVDRDDDFDDGSDFLPNEDTIMPNDGVRDTSDCGEDTFAQESSGTQIQIGDNECEVEQKFIPPPVAKTGKKRGRKPKNAEPRSPPKKKRKYVKGQCREFKCRYCPATFQSSSQYYSHRRSHDPLSSKSLDIITIYTTGSKKRIEARVCPICNETIKGCHLGNFMEHTLSHEITLENLPNPVHSCDKCEKNFFIKLNLDLHKICHHDWRHIVLKCDICKDSSHKTREDLIAHLKSHKEDTPIHLCKSCPMACTTLDKVLSHMLKHSNSKRLNCPECDHFVTPTLNELYSHCQIAHSELKQIFECELCKKPFLIPTTLSQHMRLCHGDAVGDFMCDQCSNGKIYKTKSQLQRHIEYMHSDDGTKPFKCDRCPKSFKYKSLLQQHIDEKHDKIRYPCPICAKSYCDQAQLNYHLRTHTGEDLFTCDVCGKQFPRMQQLKIHSIVHSEKTEEVCDICGKIFGNPLHLRKHKNSHKEKTLECKYCQMKFKRPDHLRSHSRIHTGERPYICPICQKGFNRRDIMIVHMGMHGFSKEEASKFYKQHEESGLKYETAS